MKMAVFVDKFRGSLGVFYALALLAMSSVSEAQMNRVETAGEVFRALNNLAKCRQTTGTSEQEVRVMIETRQVPTTRSGRCFLACMGQAYGVMDGATFRPNAAMKLVDTTMQRVGRQSPRLREHIQEIISTCSNSVPRNQDSCEMAATLTSCGMQEAHRMREQIRGDAGRSRRAVVEAVRDQHRRPGGGGRVET